MTFYLWLLDLCFVENDIKSTFNAYPSIYEMVWAMEKRFTQRDYRNFARIMGLTLENKNN